jgi:hypothetical protein
MKKDMATVAGYRRPLGYVQITAAQLAASVGITLPALPPDTQVGLAVIQAEGAAVRWRDDGVAPTAAVGMRIFSSVTVSGELQYTGDVTLIRFILEGGAPLLNCSLYE